MADKHTCCGKIWGVFGFSRCGRGAKHAHEGNWYCKTHHPPTVKQKNEARRIVFEEKFDAEHKAREEAAAAKAEMERRAALYPELLEALKRIKQTGVFVGAIAQEMMDAAIAKAEEPK